MEAQRGPQPGLLPVRTDYWGKLCFLGGGPDVSNCRMVGTSCSIRGPRPALFSRLLYLPRVTLPRVTRQVFLSFIPGSGCEGHKFSV